MKNKRALLIIILLVFIIIGFLIYKKTAGLGGPTPEVALSPPPLPQILNSQGDRLIKQNPNYHLIFSPEFNQYLISVLGSPFEKYRQEAENELLNALRIDTRSACQLKIVITTPFFANPDESGRYYKLSFCESSSPGPVATPSAY